MTLKLETSRLFQGQVENLLGFLIAQWILYLTEKQKVLDSTATVDFIKKNKANKKLLSILESIVLHRRVAQDSSLINKIFFCVQKFQVILLFSQ